MANGQKRCFIWGTPVESVERDFNKSNCVVVGSPRAGGDYEITDDAICLGDVGNLPPKQKAKLTTFLMDSRLTNRRRPLVKYDLVEKATRADELSPQMRAERLLQYLVSIQQQVGQEWTISLIAHDMEALAWTESIEGNESEIEVLVDHLTNKGWLKNDRGGYSITVDGHEHAKQQKQKKDLSQCFVAMWFDPSMKLAYEEGIKKAVEACGYTPMKIDEKQHLNKICDEALAEIRRSRFVVADFTHGDDGARGSVFYEAGFAHALGLEIIFSCQKDQEKSLHFDTRQYPHIFWKTPEDLYAQLKGKIGALMGDYKAKSALAANE